jgi:hypothetical protein
VSEGDRLTNHAVLSELPSALYRISSTPYRAMTSMHVTLLMQNVLTGFFTINLLTDSCRSRKLAVFCISFSMISTLNSSGPKNVFFFVSGWTSAYVRRTSAVQDTDDLPVSVHFSVSSCHAARYNQCFDY